MFATLYYTLKLSYGEHSTVLSESNPPKPSWLIVWDAVAVKTDCSLPAMSRKHCKRYKMDSAVSNNFFSFEEVLVYQVPGKLGFNAVSRLVSKLHALAV
eukprot:2742-Heterococcus_DN1.PRE.1